MFANLMSIKNVRSDLLLKEQPFLLERPDLREPVSERVSGVPTVTEEPAV